MQSILNEPESESAAWAQIAPLLESLAPAALAGKITMQWCCVFLKAKVSQEVGAAIRDQRRHGEEARHSDAGKNCARFFLKRGVVAFDGGDCRGGDGQFRASRAGSAGEIGRWRSR